MTIEKTVGTTCSNTEYTITPFQDIPECEGYDYGPGSTLNTPFENPLNGDPKTVTVQLDDVAPSIECGFIAPNTESINVIKDDKKTLYHYMTQTDGGIMHVSGFYSGIMVVVLCISLMRPFVFPSLCLFLCKQVSDAFIQFNAPLQKARFFYNVTVSTSDFFQFVL
ncbi:hypothetical protein N9140_00310 [bacterium]|nr:hypothetical protein [bacterium]